MNWDETKYITLVSDLINKKININLFNKRYYEERYYDLVSFLKHKYKIKTSVPVNLKQLSKEDRHTYIRVSAGYHRYKTRPMMLTLVYSEPFTEEQIARRNKKQLENNRKISNQKNKTKFRKQQ